MEPSIKILFKPKSKTPAGVLDFGLKSILMDGSMLLNMNVFNAQNDGFLIAAVVNTGTENRNIDAEFTGFEGNMMWFLSETTKLSCLT